MKHWSWPGRWVTVTLAVLALGLCTAEPAPAKRTFEDGDMVRFTGSVTNASGDPLADVEVHLEASRRNFSISRFRRLRYNPIVVSARTDDYGQYRIDWKWHHYYNHFTVSAVVPIREPGGSWDHQVMASADLSKRVHHGSPIVAALSVSDTTLLEALRTFESELDSNDEQRVYREQGKPDRVETIDYPDRQEQAWWYFELGTVYRFEDGRLLEVESFDPVPSP